FSSILHSTLCILHLDPAQTALPLSVIVVPNPTKFSGSAPTEILGKTCDDTAMKAGRRALVSSAVLLGSRLHLLAAAFSDANWTPIGSGGKLPPVAFAISGTNLYAGANLADPGGTTHGYVAKWDGSVWTDLSRSIGGGFPVVAALAVVG